MTENIKVSCQKHNLKLVRDFVWQALEEVSLPEAEKNLIVLAIDEVCTNLLVHSHQCNPEQFIEIHISLENEHFICHIHDWGQAFNIVEYQTPEMEQIIKQRKNGGMGLILVKKIMDQIKMTSNGNHHIYTFIKLLKTQKAQA